MAGKLIKKKKIAFEETLCGDKYGEQIWSDHVTNTKAAVESIACDERCGENEVCIHCVHKRCAREREIMMSSEKQKH